ncbi:MAG TPA: hypothetical protein VE782_04350, partial [Myxococcaceae bacterium]|nr:hypothetical protein [Myxococcaceae bacterium]
RGASRMVRAQSPHLEWAVSEPMAISWRVAALDPSGRQTAFSASRTLTFALGKAAPVAPSAKAVVRVRDPSSPVGFTWTLPEGATGADIEVARGATFSAPIVRLKVQGSSAEAALPGPGAYLWRVSPRGPRGLAFGASEPTPFEVKLAERLPAPALSEPAHDSVLPADLRGVRVSWREVPGAQRYEVQIDGGPATSAASAAGPARVLEGISEGEHTVRVRAVDELNLASAWSDPVPFHFGAPRTASVEFRLGGELAANGESASDLRFRLLDSRGRIIRDVRPAVYVSAGVVEAVMPDPEGFRLRYHPPDVAPAGGEAELRIEDRGFAATARLKLARHRPRVQLGIRAGWSTQFAALSSPYLGMDATWEPGWWNNHLALSARAGLHGGSAVVRFPEIGATYSVQTRVVPVTALLLYQSALAGCQARMGAGGGVQLVRSWIGERSELVATPSATAVAGLSRRIGVGRALVEVGYTLGFTEGAVARGHTGGLVTTFGYGVDL